MANDRERHRRNLHLAGLGLILISITALSGGLNKAPPVPPRMLAIGSEMDLGPLRVRPLKAWLDSRCPLDFTADAASSCLSVEAEVTNLTSASRSGVDYIVRLAEPSPPPNVFPTVELVRDRWVLSALHPQLPERVVVSWKLPKQSPPPSRVTLSLWSQQFKKRDNLQGGEGWFNPREAARLALPLTEPDPDALRVPRQ